MTLERLGIIGAGGIAELVLTTVARDLAAPLAAVSILATDRSAEKAQALLDRLGETLAVTRAVHTDREAFLRDRPTVIAECASHTAVSDHGAAVLAAGIDLVVISIGALSDAALLTTLQNTARKSGAQLVLPPGAIGGVDALAAARLSGLKSVVYTGRKPPNAWRGTAAERVVDLDALTEAVTFFDGTARTAAQEYPFNANVAAALGLAGLGLENTQVRLVADPGVERNVHEFAVCSGAGDFNVHLQGRPSPANPKTSLMAGYSVARELLNRAGAVVI